MHDLPDESDSDDDFDGYLEPEDDPIAYRNPSKLEEVETIRRSLSRVIVAKQLKRTRQLLLRMLWSLSEVIRTVEIGISPTNVNRLKHVKMRAQGGVAQ